jgi:hypothetical protein
MSHQQNIVRIKAVHQALGDLSNRVLFVGGATVSLYTDRPTGEVRPTPLRKTINPCKLNTYKGFVFGVRSF